MLFVNILAAIFSLSGSGLIILAAGLIYLTFTKVNRRYFILLMLLYVAIGIVAFSIIRRTELYGFYAGRMDEFGSTNSSAYYRFVLPLTILVQNIGKRPFGYGIGNDDIAFKIYKAKEKSITNGLCKIGVETGLLGLLLMLVLHKETFKRAKGNKALMILCIYIFFSNIVGTFMSPVFWANTLFILSVKEDKSENNN